MSLSDMSASDNDSSSSSSSSSSEEEVKAATSSDEADDDSSEEKKKDAEPKQAVRKRERPSTSKKGDVSPATKKSRSPEKIEQVTKVPAGTKFLISVDKDRKPTECVTATEGNLYKGPSTGRLSKGDVDMNDLNADAITPFFMYGDDGKRRMGRGVLMGALDIPQRFQNPHVMRYMATRGGRSEFTHEGDTYPVVPELVAKPRKSAKPKTKLPTTTYGSLADEYISIQLKMADTKTVLEGLGAESARVFALLAAASKGEK